MELSNGKSTGRSYHFLGGGLINWSIVRSEAGVMRSNVSCSGLAHMKIMRSVGDTPLNRDRRSGYGLKRFEGNDDG